jgi:hypothetical protein
MTKRTILPARSWIAKSAKAFAALLLLISSSACASDFSDETMQRLAAPVVDIGNAVRMYGKLNPDLAASLDDQELVRRATDHDPKLLEPYSGYQVRGKSTGVILVCTKDGRRGLIEDAACTAKVDAKMWSIEAAPCQFTLNLASICP